jgi:hypothetical protein
VGRAGPQRQCWAERARGKASGRESGPLLGQEGGLRLKREVGKVCFFLSFFKFLFLFKTSKQFEFKPRFESKLSKPIHRHECNSKLLYFIN